MADFTQELIIDTSVKGADKSEQQLDDLADATNKASEAGEEYTETLGDMATEVEVFGVSLDGMIGGFKNSVGAIKNSVTSLGGFKTALIATGVGAFVVILGSLVSWLQNTQEGVDFLNKALAGIGAVINGLLGLLTKLGTALVKVFKGDFKGAITDAKGALDGFVDGIIEAVQASGRLEDALKRIQLLTAKSTVLIAANNQEIAKNKRVIEDINASTSTRIKLAERNLDLIEKNAEHAEELAFMELEAERQRVNNDNAQHGRTETLIADQLILADLAAKVIETQTESEEKQIEFANKINELRAQQELERLERLQQLATTGVEVQKATRENSVEEMDLDDDVLKHKMKNLEIYLKAKEDQLAADLELEEIYRQQELQLGANLYGALASLAGQDTELGKALAIVSATINTYLGVTQALTAKTMVGRILGVAFALATGLGAVQTIKGTPVPKVQVTSTPFGDGGMIGGQYHENGGTWINAERGEGVINRRSMAIPWVKRQASYLNTIGGGVPFMARGGIVPDAPVSPFVNLEQSLASARTVLVLDDLDRAQQGEFVTQIATTL